VLELVLRIGFSLLIVLGLLWALARVARRPLSGRTGGPLAVVARQQITRGATVAVVRVVDQALIVGVTDNQITLLGEVDLVAVERTTVQPSTRRESVPLDSGPVSHPPGPLSGSIVSPQTWAQTLRFLRDRTARR
jgi:flagellar protein FliO/FliZ